MLQSLSSDTPHSLGTPQMDLQLTMRTEHLLIGNQLPLVQPQLKNGIVNCPSREIRDHRHPEPALAGPGFRERHLYQTKGPLNVSVAESHCADCVSFGSWVTRRFAGNGRM